MAPTKEKVSINIPDDLIFIILSKLAVKSLKRFSFVCKSWANLFENPIFMSIYRNNFISKHDNDDNLCLLLKQPMPNNTTHHDSSFLLSGDKFENKVKLEWPPPFQENDNNIFIFGSVVNDTLCLFQTTNYAPAPEIVLKKIVLWNPSTEEFKVIPPGSVDCPLGVYIDVQLCGFGYDPVTNDNKLIRYLWFSEDWLRCDVMEDIPHPPEPLWQIYSLKINSWRNLDVEMPTHFFFTLTGFDVYLNGACHWWGYKDFGQLQGLVSFNLSDEVFHTTPIVYNDCDVLWPNPTPLMVMNDSIARITMDAGTACFDIFILGELGVKESWTKIFTFGPLPCVDEHFIGLGKKGYMFFVKDDDELAWFDLSTQQVQEIGVKRYDSSLIVIYEESFFLLEE